MASWRAREAGGQPRPTSTVLAAAGGRHKAGQAAALLVGSFSLRPARAVPGAPSVRTHGPGCLRERAPCCVGGSLKLGENPSLAIIASDNDDPLPPVRLPSLRRPDHHLYPRLPSSTRPPCLKFAGSSSSSATVLAERCSQQHPHIVPSPCSHVMRPP